MKTIAGLQLGETLLRGLSFVLGFVLGFRVRACRYRLVSCLVRLSICDQCQRHVRATEDACPFCGCAGAARVAGVRGRASRAVLFAAALAATIDCGARTDIGEPEQEQDAEPHCDVQAPMTAYGGGFFYDAGSCK